MRVSIVTVCFNSEKTIADTLRSVSEQTYWDIEHVIIDGASTDMTANIVSEYPHVKKFISEQDNGLYDAMNKGVRECSGEVVMTLNSDDFFSCSAVVERYVEKFQNSNADAVYSDLDYVSEGLSLIHISEPTRPY